MFCTGLMLFGMEVTPDQWHLFMWLVFGIQCLMVVIGALLALNLIERTYLRRGDHYNRVLPVLIPFAPVLVDRKMNETVNIIMDICLDDMKI